MTTHVYFDLDGTLTDPYEGITKCILYALEKLGFDAPGNDWLHSCIGPPLWDTFPPIVGDALTRRAIDLYRERFDEFGWRENTPYDGIHDTLEAVRASGAHLFVATAKPHPAARRIVEHFGMGEFFDDVYGSELDGTRGQKGDLLAWAIEKNGAADARIMIGDRKHDLIGARQNGMIAVGVAWGYGSVAELEAAGAEAIAHTPAEVPALLR